MTDAQLRKFQYSYKKAFGKQLTKEEALSKARRVLRFMQINQQPLTKQQLIEAKKRRQYLQK